MKELVVFFLKIYNRQTNFPFTIEENLIFETSEKLCTIEFEILNQIGFDLNLELPYKYVHLMKSYYIDYLRNPKLIVITTNFINDSFKLPLCLYYDPLIIALASLYLVGVYFKISLPETKEGLKWYQLIDTQMSLGLIIEVGEKINKIYKFTNEAKSHSSKDRNKFPSSEHVIIFESSRILKQSNLEVSDKQKELYPSNDDLSDLSTNLLEKR